MLLPPPALAAVLTLAPGAPPQRTFVDLDPATVDASLEGVDAVLRGEPGAVVTVEVRRPRSFDGFVEPLVLRIVPKGKGAAPLEVVRVDPPFHGRAGRAAGRDPVVVPLLVPLEAAALKGARVEVLEASCWTGAEPAAEAPVELGRPSTASAFDPLYQRSISRTTIPVRNLGDDPVDVVLEAKFLKPERATSLVRGRVEGGATTELVISALPTGAGERPGVQVRAVDLVDWSVVVDRGEDEARRLLEGAWATMYRVPAERFPLAARFVREYRDADRVAKKEGTLTLAADGEVRVSLDTGPDATVERSVRADLERVLWAVARPPLDELLEGEPTLVRRGPRPVVRTERPLVPHDMGGAVAHVVEDGVLVAHAKDPLAGERGEGLPARWRWSPGPAPRLLGRIRPQVSTIPSAVREQRIGWQDLGGGLWLPTVATDEASEWSPGIGSRTTMTFTGWRTGAEPAAPGPPPQGPLADRLRAAWDGFYRYPTTEARIEASFRVKNPGTDGVWIGRREVRGSLVLEDMRGGFWASSSAEVREKRATPDDLAILAGSVLDRVLMWSGRDLCRQPPFDVAFAGATLEEDGRWILARGAEVAAVRLEGERVAALRTAFGAEATFRWKEVAGHLVPEARASGGETITVRWKEWRDGWLLPSAVEFEDVFGEDWGPETLELDDVVVTPDRD